MVAVLDGPGFKLFNEQVDYNQTNGGTHGCTMDLFIILTLEEELGIFRQNSSNAVICCVDMKILPHSCESCCNCCLMMEISGSTGIDVKRAFTSYDEMHSPSSNLMDLMWSTKCCMFLM